jgi:hypothetical protein
MSLTMTSKAVFHDERDDIVCIQLFQRIDWASLVRAGRRQEALMLARQDRNRKIAKPT